MIIAGVRLRLRLWMQSLMDRLVLGGLPQPETIRRILADALGGADAGSIAAEDLNASNDG